MDHDSLEAAISRLPTQQLFALIARLGMLDIVMDDRATIQREHRAGRNPIIVKAHADLTEFFIPLTQKKRDRIIKMTRTIKPHAWKKSVKDALVAVDRLYWQQVFSESDILHATS